MKYMMIVLAMLLLVGCERTVPKYVEFHVEDLVQATETCKSMNTPISKVVVTNAYGMKIDCVRLCTDTHSLIVNYVFTCGNATIQYSVTHGKHERIPEHGN